MPPPRHTRNRTADAVEESSSSEEPDEIPAETAVEETDAPTEGPPAEEATPPSATPLPTEVPAVAVVPSPMPSAHIMPEAPMSAPPTLDDAFFTLCAAMGPHLAEDIPAATHLDEVQAWYVNGTLGSENRRMAWTHTVQLLERVLDISLTQR